MNMKDSTKPLGRGGTISPSVRCMKKEKEMGLRGFHMNVVVRKPRETMRSEPFVIMIMSQSKLVIGWSFLCTLSFSRKNRDAGITSDRSTQRI